jgi:hypothetical protein
MTIYGSKTVCWVPGAVALVAIAALALGFVACGSENTLPSPDPMLNVVCTHDPGEPMGCTQAPYNLVQMPTVGEPCGNGGQWQHPDATTSIYAVVFECSGASKSEPEHHLRSLSTLPAVMVPGTDEVSRSVVANVTNGWTVGDQHQTTTVVAGAGHPHGSGRFVISRLRVRPFEQSTNVVRVPGAGPVSIVHAPLGPRVVHSAQRGDIEFASTSGVTGTLHLKDDTLTLDRPLPQRSRARKRLGASQRPPTQPIGTACVAGTTRCIRQPRAGMPLPRHPNAPGARWARRSNAH